jgi:calpain-7
MSAKFLETAERRARVAEQNVSLTRSRHSALAATITAAELYMQALRLASNSTEKARLDSKCKELLTKAETLKDGKAESRLGDRFAPSSSPSEASLKQPTSKRKLTTREEIILLEGSKLNGFVFLPWNDDPLPEEFELKEGQELFVDSPSLQLSPLQLKTFAGWKRPREAFAGIDISQDGLKLPTEPTMRRSKKIDLVQDMTSDCSVVASLCAGSARAERGHSRVRQSSFSPILAYREPDTILCHVSLRSH